jgi:hypothetical protein
MASCEIRRFWGGDCILLCDEGLTTIDGFCFFINFDFSLSFSGGGTAVVTTFGFDSVAATGVSALRFDEGNVRLLATVTAPATAIGCISVDGLSPVMDILPSSSTP